MLYLSRMKVGGGEILYKMAKLKCWKKAKGKDLEVYHKDMGDNIIIHKEQGDYFINIRDSRGSLKESESAQKKSQALKFANQYMKKHDKC